MGIGVSLILIATGAILTWAVNATVSGLDINTVGVILMVVGLAGLVLSLMFWSSWGGVGSGYRRRTTYSRTAPAGRSRPGTLVTPLHPDGAARAARPVLRPIFAVRKCSHS